MISVQKGKAFTEIMEIFLDKYIKAGWKVVNKVEENSQDDAVNIIAEYLNPKDSADNRKRNITTNSRVEAISIAAKELKKKQNKQFTDDLIKKE